MPPSLTTELASNTNPVPGTLPPATDSSPALAIVTPNSSPPVPRAPAAAQETAGERLARAAAETAARAPPPLRMDRAPDAGKRVPAGVSAGYEALRQGDHAAARRGYEAALAADPASVDAHLGMATLAARGANRAAAADHYRRALDLDPRNPTALAGLASLADFSRPDAIEEALRADLARNPESGALQFTLGNVYAAQGRWNEAQAAYFEAHRLDPASADVAHNLAVSLDHLGQRKLAAEFYARALETARGRGAQFDPAAVARRLAEIR
jgi:Tfp pilus assembly protein PilF